MQESLQTKQELLEKAKCYAKMGQICSMLKVPNYAITFYTNAIEILEEQNKLTKILIKCYKNRRKAYLQVSEMEKANTDLKLILEARYANKKK